MEGYLVIFLIVAGLVLGAYMRKERLTMDASRTAATRTFTPVAGSSFDKSIKAYRDNYLNYKLTGKQEYKTAYLSAQAVVEQYIADSEKKLKTDAEYVDKVVKDYANANPRLQAYKKDAQNVRAEGPVVEGQYMVEKKLREPQQVDMKSFYIKLGVAGLIMGVGLVAGFLK